MTFLWPVLLLAIVIVPIGVVVARRIDESRRARVGALAGRRSDAPAATAAAGARPTPVRSRILAHLPGALVVTGFALLAIAVARPQATISLPRVEGTLVLTFDVSGSMAADDVTPSRMEAAKTAAKAIVDRQPPGVVIGVVAFSDAGLTVQEPTSDPATTIGTIDRLAPTHGTSVGQGILAALGAIRQAESDIPAGYYSNRSAPPTPPLAPVAPGSHAAAAVVLFSDGENNERPDPVSAATVAANLGIRILTIGVGTTTGTTLDLDGFRVQTSLDEGLLQRVADITAGAYQPAAQLDPAAVYDQLAKHLVARDEKVELTALVAGAALLLLVLGAGLSLVRTGRLP
ncbi:MAG TPA: VWA domain-containing protein [Candidatus Limnocylindrales bacterium]|jgi:Ca-activated chloride channel family protein